MADKNSSTPAPLRQDRRQAQVPITGEDRRKGERRSGAERRTTPRADTAE